jgi:hypothetical protein
MAQNQFETIPFVTNVRRFEPFYGANHKMMQRLLTGKDKGENQVDFPRILVSPKRLEELRLGRVGSEADKKEFRNNALGHRAIGVVYHPQYEHRGNYVPSIMPLRYDAFVFIDETKALNALHIRPDGHQIPETYPFGV